MSKILFCFLLLLLSYAANAYSDTSWLNKRWKVCGRDSSVYYSISVRVDSLWDQQMYYSVNHQLYMKGQCKDSLNQVRTGAFIWYNKKGIFTDSIIYQKGLPIYSCSFHENGKRKTLLLYDDRFFATYVNSWDEQGRETTSDTFYQTYLHRECHRDTAQFKGIIQKQENTWRLKFYYTWNDSLVSDADYKDRLGKSPIRFKRYNQNGLVRDSVIYHDNGKPKDIWYFYKSGMLNAHHGFDTSGKRKLIENWDETGSPVKADTSFRYAGPVEGFKSWQKRILKKINKDDSVDWGYRKNLYGSVYIGFFVEEDGSMAQVFISQPSLYPRLDSLILKICKEQDTWKPCTIHGRRERFYGVHSFSFIAGKVIKYHTLY